MKDTKRRLQVTLTNENADYIEELASRFGVTSSQLCAVWLGQMTDTYRCGLTSMQNSISESVRGGKNA